MNNKNSDQENLEEHYGFRTRKEERAERREASARDRSQYKKTDQKKKHHEGTELHPYIKTPREELKRGRVLSIISQDMTVDCEGKLYTCVLRGLLKKERTHLKTLVAVGDCVLFEQKNDTEGVIVHVEPRKSVLARADHLSQRKQQIIAANVDQVLITVSVINPPLKPFLIDRYIIASHKGNMTPIVVVNKMDLLHKSDEEQCLLEAIREAYAEIDIPVVCVSIVSGEGREALRDLMREKVSVFSGQSGVGKSSLINMLTGLDLPTRETVKKTHKGAHTTATASLIPLDFGGWCVDTPGIKSFGVWDLEQEEVERYYTEIHEQGKNCHFSPCTHTHEPKCAVREAVEEETISELRYYSYLQLIESLASEHKRR